MKMRRVECESVVDPFAIMMYAIVGSMVIAAFVVFLTGCSVAVPADHAAADRAIYAAVAPRYLAYTEADPRLTPAQKARRHRTLEWWAYEAGVTTTAAPAPEDGQ